MVNPEQHADNRNIVESILRHIPGFKGYLEKEYRRESDHLTRQWMADRLLRAKRDLDEYMRVLVDAGQLDQLTAAERLRTRLDGLGNKIKGAVRGYSGFFDYVKVDEAVLDRVYQQDMGMLDEMDHFARSFEQLTTKSEAETAMIADLARRIGEIEDKFNRRSEILQGLDSTP